MPLMHWGDSFENGLRSRFCGQSIAQLSEKPMHKELRLLLLLVLAGCGENQDTTSPSTQVGPPENLKALSVNGTSVGLQWTPPSGPADSLGGYVVQWGAKRDTLGKTALSFVADSLTPVEKTFTVYSRRVSGALSDGAEIKWATGGAF